MKIISWNLNGLRAAWQHGLSALVYSFDADIYCFQETKVNEPFPPAEVDGYRAYWSFSERKGYSGTMILTKYTPVAVRCDMENFSFQNEGRVIALEFENFFLVDVYVPNSQGSKVRYDYRERFDRQFTDYLVKLKMRKPVVVCGDFNATVSDVDIYEDSNWQWKNKEGFLQAERARLLDLMDEGFVDSFRYLHPDAFHQYSWWSNRLFKREENKGWRFDYFFVSKDIISRVKKAEILNNIYGSDHCPILLETDLDKGLAKVPHRFRYPAKYTYDELVRMKKNAYEPIMWLDLTYLWDGIDWERAEKTLLVFQKELAQAAQTYDYARIEECQKRIVYHIGSKVLAVRYVCEHATSTGVDRISWSTSHDKMFAALSLSSRGYRAMPSRYICIKDRKGKERRCCIDTYFDRAMKRLYMYALEPIAETQADRYSFAFRKGRSTYDVNEYIIRMFTGENAPRYAVIMDVKSYYDSISHRWIMRYIPLAQNVLEEFLRVGYLRGEDYVQEDVGINLASGISSVIANMVLDGLQEYITNRLYPIGEEVDAENGKLIRFADDIVVSAKTRKDAENILRITRDFLRERGLELHPKKSQIFDLKKEEFTFMSRAYRLRDDILYCRPSTDAVGRFMTQMRDLIEDYEGSQAALIETINRKISGFTTYHKVSEAEAEYKQIDNYIRALLLQLCEKKHPKWTRQKILDTYWYEDHLGRHCYSLPDKRSVQVMFCQDTLFYVHDPVDVDYNPFLDTDYLQMRSQERKIFTVSGVYKKIWRRQNGKCFYCGCRMLDHEDKVLIDVDNRQASLVKQKAYIHARCAESSLEFTESEILPTSLNDLMDLLLALESEENEAPVGEKYRRLSEFFRTCDKRSVTLRFKEIENIMGEPLGQAALFTEYWYRDSFDAISQCWLNNGYEVRAVYTEGNKRVRFALTPKAMETTHLEIPEKLRSERIPKEAKYELENYFDYIIKKYGL